uniref:Uncharacterized protein n=1 Tax=Molossus molossus TaxID=27622 RepID=A0A7J8CZB5_MOLMO|nr:hypothetical protein HJG59_009509 [Molossus molossus]
MWPAWDENPGPSSPLSGTSRSSPCCTCSFFILCGHHALREANRRWLDQQASHLLREAEGKPAPTHTHSDDDSPRVPRRAGAWAWAAVLGPQPPAEPPGPWQALGTEECGSGDAPPDAPGEAETSASASCSGCCHNRSPSSLRAGCGCAPIVTSSLPKTP